MFLKVTKWNPKLNVKDRFQNFILQTYCLVWQSYWAKAATQKHSPRSGRRNRPSKGRTIMIVWVYQFQEFIKVWKLHVYYCVSSENLWTRIQGKMVLSCSVVGCSTERGGVKLCSHSSIFRRKQGFNQLGALCFKILYLTEQSRPKGILYCQWMIKFDRMYLLLAWLHAPSSRIRSRHFEEKDISNNRLSPTAIPINTNISNNNNGNNFQKGQSCI